MHTIGAHHATAPYTSASSQPRTTSPPTVLRKERSNVHAASTGVRCSRRPTTTSVIPTSMAQKTNAPPRVATSVASGLSNGPATPARIDMTTSPPTTPDRARMAWLVSVPNQGTSRSSRTSMVEMAATQPPATGPPSVIAATSNGRWNVRTARRPKGVVRRAPNRPRPIQNRRPDCLPSSTSRGSPGFAMLASIGSVAVAQARTPKPATVEAMT